ncbi:MAG: S41 family peptidase [Gemmatimonadaceae bacterium]
MRSRATVTIAVLAAALVCGGWLLERGLARGGTSVSGTRLFSEVMSHVQRHFVDSLDAAAIYEKATAGMMRELRDPYSVYLTSDRARRLSETTSGTYAGVGIQVDVRNEAIVVVTPLPGTPAERAGILAADRIVAIDGRSTSGWTFEEAQKALRGAKGTTVKFTVRRDGVPDLLTFTLERDEIHVHSVRHAEMLEPRVGYIDLTIFSDSSAAELRRAVDSLRAKGMQTLLFDLRNNPGGVLEQGVEVSDLFLDAGQRIVSMRGRSPGATRDFADAEAQRWPSLVVVALVNESSASASEIVAGALQDHDRALLIGNTTYGKGSAQSVFAFTGGAALKLTTARWFTPSGRTIQRGRDTSGTAADDEGVTSDSAGAPLDKRLAYRTDAGRTVFGGGGITPDLLITRIDTTPGDGAFARGLGRDVPKFRDALTELALAVRAARSVSGRDFVVTPQMRDDLWRRMAARHIAIARSTYDSAAALVSRRIADEVTRYTFGPDAAFDRQLRNDRVVITALELAKGAATERDVLARGAERRARKNEDAPRPR